MPGVHQHNSHTGECSLVLDKVAKLAECPGVMLPPLAPANRHPVSDAPEVFQGNTATGVFGLCNKPLADYVVDVAGEAPLFAGAPLEKPSSRPGALPLKPGAEPGVALSEPIDLGAFATPTWALVEEFKRKLGIDPKAVQWT